MAEIIVEHAPNTSFLAHAPGDTSWHKVVPPKDVPIGQAGVHVMMKSVDVTGFGDGAAFQMATNLVSAPTAGFMVSAGGQTLSLTFDQNLWLCLSDSTDQIHLLWGW